MKKTTFLLLLVTAALSVSWIHTQKNKEQNPVIVTTVSVSNPLQTAATCYFSATGDNITEKGVCWNTKTNPTIANNKNSKPEGKPTNYHLLITNLEPGTNYYVRAYAKKGNEIIYGNELSFQTKPKESSKNTNVGKKVETKPEQTKK